MTFWQRNGWNMTFRRHLIQWCTPLIDSARNYGFRIWILGKYAYWAVLIHKKSWYDRLNTQGFQNHPPTPPPHWFWWNLTPKIFRRLRRRKKKWVFPSKYTNRCITETTRCKRDFERNWDGFAVRNGVLLLLAGLQNPKFSLRLPAPVFPLLCLKDFGVCA